MAGKFPKNKADGFVIFRKSVCLLLAFTLVVVQSGCYTTRVVQTLNQEKIIAAHTESPVLESGQLVRMTYVDGNKTRRWEGRLKSVRMEGVVISQRQPGMLTTKDVIILRHQIKRIDILDRKLDVVTTVVAGTAGGMILFVIFGFIISISTNRIGFE